MKYTCMNTVGMSHVSCREKWVKSENFPNVCYAKKNTDEGIIQVSALIFRFWFAIIIQLFFHYKNAIMTFISEFIRDLIVTSSEGMKH